MTRRGRKVPAIDPATIQSPCISICVFNEDDYCVGCKRSMNEVGDWHRYSEEMKAAVTLDLIERKLQ